MNAVAVVEHLKSLATDPKNRGTIVQDEGCLAGLVLFLDNPSVEVITTALETLKLLAQHVPNRQTMRDEMGMMVSLKAIMNRDGFDAAARKLAYEVYRALMSSGSSTHSRRAGKGQFFLGTSNKKAKIVTLQIKGMKDQVTRKMCEEALLTIRGIISFTFDMVKSRCLVRIKAELQAEQLCVAVNKTKVLQAQQVVKNEQGEEVFLSFGSAPLGEAKQKPNPSSLPDYLPEDDEDHHESSNKSVARVGDTEKENTGWFSSISSFVSNTLYW